VRFERIRHRLAPLVAITTLVLAGATTFGGVHPSGAAVVASTASVTTISSNRSTARYAQPITLSAHVIGPGGTPTGTVAFAANGTPLGSAPLTAGTATLSIASLSTDLSSGVTATYGGDATYASSASSPLTIATSKNLIFLFLQPVSVGPPDGCDGQGNCDWTVTGGTQVLLQAVLFNQNPSSDPPPTASPTGTVTFHKISGDQADLGSAPVVNGIAELSMPNTSSGNFVATYAEYSGDTNFTPAQSRQAAFTFVQPPPPPRWRFETNDGATGTASGHLSADIGAGASTVTYLGGPHVFSYDATNGNLRHAWYAGGWHAETLDGAGADSFGRVNADVGRHTAAVMYNGTPHVFYYDATNGDLRHGFWTGHAWRFENLDGAAGSLALRHVVADVGETPTVNTYGTSVQVYFHDVTNGDLRHVWWDGAHWSSETLDGNVNDAAGRKNANVGTDATVTLYNGGPQVWYHDTTNGDLRHAWWNGRQWSFETLDGDVDASSGRVSSDLGDGPSVVLFGGTPHVWYHDSSAGALRHAWWTGARWLYEDLDGFGGFFGEVVADTGEGATAMLLGGTPHVWYRDATHGYLRHAWWDGSEWVFEALDGFTGGDGRVAGDVGNEPSILLFNGQPHVWYHDTTHGGLRHAWFG
jgi:hypothetical protein